MTRSDMKLALAIASGIGFAALLAAPNHAAAQKGAPACGASFLPFYEGQVFEYEWLAPEVVSEESNAPRGPQADWPLNVKIAVAEIKGGKKKATIKLVETYRKRVIETEIKCDEKGFRISPQSFFFAGEPGGGIGMTLSNVKQDQAGLPSARDFRSGLEWTSYITAEVARKVSEGKTVEAVTEAKLEIDRTLYLRGKQAIETGLGEMRGYRLDVELSGRAAVAPTLDKWRDLPSGQLAMWLVPGKGLVRVHNRFGHGWQIKEITYAGK